MSSSSRPAASVPELDAPPSVGSSMPPELAVDMARAGELLDLGDTIGAWRIVRRVLDRAAPELLGELADLATDLGLGEEDLSTAPGRRADVVWRRPPEGWRCGSGRSRRRAWRSSPDRPAPGRSGPGGGVAATAATRRRPTPRPVGASTTTRSATSRPPATPSTTTAPPSTGCTRRCAWVAASSAPRPTWPGRRGVRGLPRRRARARPAGAALRGHPRGRGAPRSVGPPPAAGAVERRRRGRAGEGRRLGRRPRRRDPPGPARALTRTRRAPGPVTTR